MAPLVAVVVPTYRRPLRLRWLLNALSEQDGAFEVVVGHDCSDEETARLLAAHPLRPRAVPVADGRGPAAKRNAAWRASGADLIVFTDDDCRPPPGWLAALVAASGVGGGGSIVQGATRPDPDELGVFHHAPHARSQCIDPPNAIGQTCNIAYPRSVLEACGGFDESLPDAVGEDTDLFVRADAPVVAAPDAVTYHAVDWGLRGRLRASTRWAGMARLVRNHPELRREMALGGYAWKREHATWLLAAAGASRVRTSMWSLAVALPWIAGTPRRYGNGRGLVRWVSELPGEFVADGWETLALLRGSVKHRSFLL